MDLLSVANAFILYPTGMGNKRIQIDCHRVELMAREWIEELFMVSTFAPHKSEISGWRAIR
jgi:hypothetical protein